MPADPIGNIDCAAALGVTNEIRSNKILDRSTEMGDCALKDLRETPESLEPKRGKP